MFKKSCQNFCVSHFCLLTITENNTNFPKNLQKICVFLLFFMKFDVYILVDTLAFKYFQKVFLEELQKV